MNIQRRHHMRTFLILLLSANFTQRRGVYRSTTEKGFGGAQQKTTATIATCNLLKGKIFICRGVYEQTEANPLKMSELN